ncbi:MAG TPA: hypothetical protein VFS33_08400 [Gemmatimonadales bacterium]|nr:hypothetical protein [Gemmatimonadales bacterium]
MLSERLALYTTVYPGVERYLAAWYRSVLMQTDRRFDLWIGSDGLSPEAVAEAVGATPDASWVYGGAGESGGRVRAHAIELMADVYDGIVFVDSDDLLEPSRVSAARAALRECDVAGCALRIVDEAARDTGAVFGLDAPDDLGTILPRHNVLGLSNTAYRSAVLRRCLPVPPACELLDWLLGTRAWASGARLGFDPVPRMRYRQYAQNVAQVLPPFSETYVLRATERVLGHYDCLKSKDWPLPEAPHRAIDDAHQRARAFHDAIFASAVLRERYVAALNALPPHGVWWWCVANPELECIWRN